MDAELNQLTDLAANLRRIDALGAAVAEEALPEVLAAARETAERGTSPAGGAWAPRKDGQRALANAAGAIRAVVSGTTQAVITLVIGAPYVYHHNAHGKRQRQILFDPAEGVPVRMVDAIARAAARVIPRALGGR